MKKAYVLDSNAALDYLEGGPGMHRVTQLLKDALEQRIVVLMSVGHIGEVCYHVWQQHGEEAAKRAINELFLMSVQPVDIDMAQTVKAAEIKARHQIPYLDSFAAALATTRQAVLVTGDHDFEKLGRHANVLWIHRR